MHAHLVHLENKTKVYYGVHKEDCTSLLPSTMAGGGAGAAAKRRRDRESKKKDVNVPPAGRVPLPDWCAHAASHSNARGCTGLMRCVLKWPYNSVTRRSA
jgi:hypothetical protein